MSVFPPLGDDKCPDCKHPVLAHRTGKCSMCPCLYRHPPDVLEKMAERARKEKAEREAESARRAEERRDAERVRKEHEAQELTEAREAAEEIEQKARAERAAEVVRQQELARQEKAGRLSEEIREREAAKRKAEAERMQNPQLTREEAGVKRCSRCGLAFEKGDVGWHFERDKAGRVSRLCPKCWQREVGQP